LGKVLSIVALALLATAAPAVAQDVYVLVVTGDQPPAVQGRGAAGLYVPGQGLYASREEALERLGPLPQQACGAIGQCEFELFVSVPPLGSQKNDKRYEVTILGDGYRGILSSDQTRIPGLVSIGDIRETVEALEEGRDPPLEWRESKHPIEDLRELDERLSDARAAQGPATVAFTLALIALVALALLTRSALLARAALLYPLVAIGLALGASALQQVGPLVTPAVVLAAVPLALLASARVPLTLATPVFLAGYGLVLALSPETNALMAIGPHPWSGGRFYGVTNQFETLLLGPALAAGFALRGWWLVALALLSLVVVGASDTGADGGGILVFATGFAVLGLLLHGRSRAVPLAVLGAAVVGLAFVGIDALAGGSSHVTDAVSGGPRELFDTFRQRAERSVSIATSTVWQLATLVAGVALLGTFARLKPRVPVVDAFLVAIAVSLVVNDSPTKVAAYGAIVCGALRAWSVSRQRPLGIESPT
jgi:hypothetical protein